MEHVGADSSGSPSPLRLRHPPQPAARDGTLCALWMSKTGQGPAGAAQGGGFGGGAGRAVQPPSFFVCAVVEASEVLGACLGGTCLSPGQRISSQGDLECSVRGYPGRHRGRAGAPREPGGAL